MSIFRKKTDRTLYSSPFCYGFWKSAFSEVGNLRMLVLAAIFVALRIAVKSTKIPVGEMLSISFDFYVNAVGSMIYGPIMGLIVGAISDTIGAIFFPTGPYFFPFIFVEMLSSFLFGLILYRAKLSAPRIILSRFVVVVLCNFILTPVIMKPFQLIYYGKDYALFRWARVIKNLCLFPVEATLLVLWLAVLSRLTYQMKLTHSGKERLRLSAGGIALIVVLTILSAAGILLYYHLKKNNLV